MRPMFRNKVYYWQCYICKKQVSSNSPPRLRCMDCWATLATLYLEAENIHIIESEPLVGKKVIRKINLEDI